MLDLHVFRLMQRRKATPNVQKYNMGRKLFTNLTPSCQSRICGKILTMYSPTLEVSFDLVHRLFADHRTPKLEVIEVSMPE